MHTKMFLFACNIIYIIFCLNITTCAIYELSYNYFGFIIEFLVQKRHTWILLLRFSGSILLPKSAKSTSDPFRLSGFHVPFTRIIITIQYLIPDMPLLLTEGQPKPHLFGSSIGSIYYTPTSALKLPFTSR